MYLRNFQRLKPCNRAINPSTRKTNSALVRYTQSSSLPNGSRVFRPYLPMVNAIAPNAPIGATFIISAITSKVKCVSDSAASTIGSRIMIAGQRYAEENRDQQHLQDLAVGESPRQGVGNHVHHEIHGGQLFPGRGVLLHGLRVERCGVRVDAGAGLNHLDHDEPHHQRERWSPLRSRARPSAPRGPICACLLCARCQSPQSGRSPGRSSCGST